jgi:tRNA pseudouridine38-40 synthase
MRYLIALSYDGTNYHGWQVQPHSVSVQQKVNEALTLLLRTPIEVTGAGRTDTGVCAAKMYAHFDAPQINDVKMLSDRLNRVLPPDIAVAYVKEVAEDFHARFSATHRTYYYYVYTRKNPFLRHFATQLYYTPDYQLMNQAARFLLEVSDFTSFSKLHTDVKTNICRVTHAEWVQIDGDYWRFEITADRFLRNMVRAVVGTLLEVGRGRMTIDEFKQVVACKNRCAAGDSAPGKALQLVDVGYEGWGV